jgi:PAS domain S-box-containing protein
MTSPNAAPRRIPSAPGSLRWFVPMSALALAAIVTLAIGMASDGHALLWMNTSWTLAGVFALAGAWRAMRRATGGWKATWRLLTVAAGIWVFGQLLWNLYGVRGFPASPNPADFCWMAFAALVAVALYRLLPAPEGARRVGRLETMLLIAAVGSSVLALLFGDLDTSSLPWPARLTALAYPIAYVSVPVMLLQVALVSGSQLRRRPDLILLFVGLTCEAIAFMLWAPPLLGGTYVPGTSVLDVLWTAGMLTLGAAGLSARPGERAVDDAAAERHLVRGGLPALVFMGMLIGLFTAALSGAALGARISLQVGLLVVGAILVAHSTMLLREQRRLLTQQRATHAALARAQETSVRFFEISRDLLGTAGLDGRFTTVNPAWTETLGYTREEITSVPFIDYVHPDDVERTLAETQKLFAGTDSVDFENRYRAKDGSWHWLTWQARVSPEEQLIYARATDITDRRRSVRELAGLNRELQGHAAELERSNSDLQQFAYIASHDLSEPLRTVSNFAQLLEKRYDGELDERGHRYISHVVEGAERMQRLIQDLLTYSRIGQGGVEHAAVDVGASVADVFAGLSRTIQERGAEISVGELPVVVADRTQIEQIFQNLIANALKFCDEDQPRIQVAADEDAVGWTFSVTDNGIGIEERHAKRIFQVFQRLHGRVAYPGTGIGLAVCKRAVECHGGAIWAEPNPGGGTRFSFTLPFREPSSNEVSA